MKLWVVVPSCLLLFAQGNAISQDQLSAQEVFFLRRQAEFWKDRDYDLMKKQIVQFLAEHESSNIHNNLWAMMGDILYQEQSYAEALGQYARITDPSLQEKTADRRLQCLYLTGAYDEVIEKLRCRADLSCEMQFILGDTLFRKMRATSDLAFAMEAKPLLTDLLETSYQEKVLLPLAEIHRELKEFKEASSLYMSLAEKNREQQEDFLLQAAVLQTHFDTLVALSTFRQIVDLGGEKATDAAYHELLLLFQNDQYSNLIERAPKLEVFFSGDRKAQFDFCLARSYFKIDLFPESVEHLTAFIQQETGNTAYKRAAFLMLIHCAKETEDGALFDQTLPQFLSAFPNDEEAGKSLLLHAQIALKNGNLHQATHDLTQLLHDFPDFPDQETLLYDRASLLCKTEQWEESRLAFKAYLEKFPMTPHASAIWPSIVHCSIQELKKGVGSREELVSDLKQALSLEENTSYQLLLGQLLFELHHFEEAASQLDKFLQNDPDHPEACLLKALSLKETGSDLQQFTLAAEKALALSEDPDYRIKLRLHLFNAYLSLEEYNLAAEHLYHAFIIDQSPIQQENQLWLAHYYLQTAHESCSDLERTKDVFKKVLQLDDNFAVGFDPSQTHLEMATLQFAQILDPREKACLLRSLLDLQSSHSHLPWKNKGQALFELAKVFVELKYPEGALQKIEEILSQETSPLILNPAILEKTRILRAQEDVKEGSPNLQLVLSMLKDLQIQKDLSNEPVHLEAAFDYADLRTELASPESRIESALFFLNRIREDFNAIDDHVAQEYHEARLRFPEKDHMFQSYMQCLEAEILSWEAKDALQNNDVEKAEHNREVATQLLEAIIRNEKTTNYLRQRAESKLKIL